MNVVAKFRRHFRELLKSRPTGQGGLTLLEILMVLALLGFVLSIVGQRVFSAFNRGNVRATKILIKRIEGELDRYKLDCGSYPSTEQGLAALVTAPTVGKKCRDYDPSGYNGGAKEPPKDAWQNDLKYESDGRAYKIISLGEDGTEGGDGQNADISSGEE